MTILVLAAGLGSRYGKQKQFDTLGCADEFLFEYNIFDAIKSGFNHVVVVTNKENQDFINNYLKNKLPSAVQLDVVVQAKEDVPEEFLELAEQRIKPWGTSHAVWSARDVITDAFVTVNGDDFYGLSAFQMAAEIIKKSSSDKHFGMVAYSLVETLSENGTVSRGVCMVQNNNLSKVQEFEKIQKVDTTILDQKTDTVFTGEELVSMNFWVCQPSIFNEIDLAFKKYLASMADVNQGEILLPTTIQDLIKAQKIAVAVVKTNSNWFGVTYAADKMNAVQELKKMTNNNLYPSPLWN